MKQEQRNRVEEIKDLLMNLKQELHEMAEEEQTKYNNAPENLQNSETYTRIEEAANELSEAVDNLDQVDSNLDKVLSI
jgi:DNA repair ATPase RecN